MKYRSTWILLVITAAGFLYYFLVEQPRHRRRLEGIAGAARLTDIAADSVTRLVIERPDVTVEFHRSGGSWRMTRPVSDEVDLSVLNVMLQTVTNAIIETRIETSAARLSEYGLLAPGARVMLATEDDSLRVSIGDFNMTQAACYVVRNDEEDVLLVAAGLRRYAHRTVFEYRDKKVAAFRVEDVTELALVSPSQRLDWWKTGAGSWQALAGGDTIRGERQEIEGVLRALRAMRADSLMLSGPDGARHLFARPAGTVALGGVGENGVTFVFAGDPETCWVTNGRRVARVDPAILGILSRTLHDLRDRRVVHFEAASLARVTLQAGNRTTSVVRPDGEWSFPNPGMGAIDQAAVREFLGVLESLRFRDILSEEPPAPGAHGLDAPSFVLTLFDGQGEVIDRFAAGETESGRRVRFATSRSAPLLAIVDVEPLDDLRERFEGFRTQ
ncbi:MAG: DUF4340 domain-containing protein [Candidatus Krumholzibacteriia bacterium]